MARRRATPSYPCPVLIIAPPSEAKLPPAEDGEPVDLDALSFPTLTPLRTRILEALIETSAQPDGRRRLFAPPGRAGEVARNVRIRELATRRASETYTGPFHEGLDAASFTTAEAERAEGVLVIASALWGALRPHDRIPPYRMHVCSRLVGMERLEPTWRAVLPRVMATETPARDGLVLDLRSPAYQAIGRPTGADERTVTLRVVSRAGDGRRLGDVIAKRVRGEAARHLLASGEDPADAAGLADVLATRWPVELSPRARPDEGWTVALGV